MAEPITLAISATALIVSATTAWLTLFRRGRVRMTQPTVIFFGPDGGTPQRKPRPKVFLRTLLFSTSKRGSVIESIHVRLSRDETRQNFNIWVYGDDKLVRGSGLFVGETGVAANHHFLLPEDAPQFQFGAGSYLVEVVARILGEKPSRLLFSQTLDVTDSLATALASPDAGLYFDWGPDSARYLPHIDRRAQRLIEDRMLQILAGDLPEAIAKSATKDSPTSG
jgi:hypothetical protein